MHSHTHSSSVITGKYLKYIAFLFINFSASLGLAWFVKLPVSIIFSSRHLWALLSKVLFSPVLCFYRSLFIYVFWSLSVLQVFGSLLSLRLTVTRFHQHVFCSQEDREGLCASDRIFLRFLMHGLLQHCLNFFLLFFLMVPQLFCNYPCKKGPSEDCANFFCQLFSDSFTYIFTHYAVFFLWEQIGSFCFQVT